MNLMILARALVFSLALCGAAASPAQWAAAAPAQSATRKIIDINSASETDLEHLQGIGPVMAKKIIQGRPYKSKDELVRRHILPVSAYGPIKDHVVAHHGLTAQAASARPASWESTARAPLRRASGDGQSRDTTTF
jgi:hypothetical protein